MSTIITSGYKFIDIDALACIFAYNEFLDLKNKKSEIVITAEFNSSITKKYRNLNFSNIFLKSNNDEFVIMDVSDPDHFEKFVDLKLVSRIFDHHPGFEKYWYEKIGKNSIIEPIGAAATLVFREFKNEKLLSRISPQSAELLAIAILSNTLNFQAKITKEEDKNAYVELKKYFFHSTNFEERYFSEVQANVEKNILDSLKNDSKQINQELFIAQLEVWDSKHVIDNYQTDIKYFLKSVNSKIKFLNLIELGKKRNMLICNDNETLLYIQNLFPEFSCDFENKIAITPHVILRKEIITRIFNETYKK